jgi:two-component system, cell cycle sensor histidine kinase and response regulator CckA
MTREERTAADPILERVPDPSLTGNSPHWRPIHWRTWWLALAWLVVAMGLAAIAWAVRGVGWTDGMAPGVMAAFALAGAAWCAGRAKAPARAADFLFSAAESAPEGYAIAAPSGAFVYVNRRFRDLLAPAEGEVMSLASLERRLPVFDVLGEEAAKEYARVKAAAAGGIAVHAEIPMLARSGAVEWRRVSVHPLPAGRWGDASGHVMWHFEDITARREVEEVRRREDELMADYLDHLPVGFFSADSEGRIRFANHTLARWLAFDSGELHGEEIFFPEFVVGAGGDDDVDPGSHGEVTLRRRDGGTFRAYLAQSQMNDSDGGFAYSRSVVLRDVAPLADANGLANSVQRLRWLFDEAPVGIALLDLKGDVTECNRALSKLLGLHREALIGRPFSERISLEDRDDAAGQLSKVVMGTMAAIHLEVRMPRGGSGDMVASLYASPMEDVDGEVSGLVLHFIDTTEQKHLESQFVQSQKMQAVGQLAGGVAHDFNNLLTAMVGFCDLLLERHGPDDPSFADIMQIKQNVNRAVNLVRQLLAFSRKQTLQPVILDVTEALSELSNLLHRLIGETIELDIEHGRELCAVRVDPGQFDQVIINLAVNARDAMLGGGTLSIRTSNVTVDETMERGAELMPAGDYALIEVMDTGSGISKEDIGRIFEPFFSTKEVGAGTGLGLSTVYGIIRQTGGFIIVDSAPGRGTHFKIYLPSYTVSGDPTVIAETLPPGEATDGAEADLTGSGTVLLVEDEDAVRLFGVRALRNKGYRVLEAKDGEMALDVINASDTPIDLIISDVVMPGMDGHTLVRLVRHEHPAVKIILISGYAEDVVPEEIGRDPTIHFLPKPFSLKSLAGKVKEVMAG